VPRANKLARLNCALGTSKRMDSSGSWESVSHGGNAEDDDDDNGGATGAFGGGIAAKWQWQRVGSSLGSDG
jgi:hypothetical protein